MNADSIQALINLGYRSGATFLGRSSNWYRSGDPTSPAISDLNLIGTLMVRVDPNPAFNASKPMQYGKPQLYGLYDRTNTQLGDYLVTDEGTYFIASQENLNPAMLIQTSDVLTFSRPVQYPNSDPAQAYAGTPSQYTDVLVQVPASLLNKTRAEKSDLALPGDPKFGTFEVLLPDFGVPILSSDRVTDQRGNQYSVETPEITALGYRILITSENT